MAQRICISNYGSVDTHLKVDVTTDLTDRFADLQARLELGEGIVGAVKSDRYSFVVRRGNAFRWNEGPLDAMIEAISEALDYTDPEIVNNATF